MFGWWQRFVDLPDRERAKILARAAFVVILALLYALGGVSLYLRARYLGPTPTAPASALLATLEPTATSGRPSPTLYPTMTPRPVGGAKLSGTPLAIQTLVVTSTLSPTSSTQ